MIREWVCEGESIVFLVALAFRLWSLADSCDIPRNDAGLDSDNAGARADIQNPSVLGIGSFPHLQSVTNSKHVNAISEVWQDYIHRVPVVMHDNFQREACKRYFPRIPVTWLQLLRKVNEYWHPPPLRLQKHTDLRAHDFAHSPDL